MNSEPRLYANVWLKPGAGDPAPVERFFRAAGFEVGAGSGSIFTIAGDRALFEQVFGATLQVQTAADGHTPRAVTTAQADPTALPLARLPDEVKARLNTVAFDEPPDFGPVSYE